MFSSGQTINLKTIATSLLLALSLFVSGSLYAKEVRYSWKNISFTYRDNWNLMTGKNSDGSETIQLLQQADAKKAVNVYMKIIPKDSDAAKYFDSLELIPNAMALNYFKAHLKNNLREVKGDDMVVSFNEIVVAFTITPSALITMPTAEKDVYVSAQTFYLNKPRYYILGMVVTQIDKNMENRGYDFSLSMASIYKTLAEIKISKIVGQKTKAQIKREKTKKRLKGLTPVWQ